MSVIKVEVLVHDNQTLRPQLNLREQAERAEVEHLHSFVFVCVMFVVLVLVSWLLSVLHGQRAITGQRVALVLVVMPDVNWSTIALWQSCSLVLALWLTANDISGSSSDV